MCRALLLAVLLLWIGSCRGDLHDPADDASKVSLLRDIVLDRWRSLPASACWRLRAAMTSAVSLHGPRQPNMIVIPCLDDDMALLFASIDYQTFLHYTI
jgi:hypothetical protein